MTHLQERLDEFKKAFESGAPPYNAPREAIEKMDRATAELKASGIEDRALKVGDRASSFTLFNQDHVQVALTDVLRAEWSKHSTHFASGGHAIFSMRNTEGSGPRVTRSDIERARAEQWWGKVLTVSPEQIIQQ